MKQFEGIAENIETPILGLVTRNPLSLSRGKSVLVTEETSLLSRGFAGLVIKDSGKKKSSLPQAKVSAEVFDKLEGRLRDYRQERYHNGCLGEKGPNKSAFSNGDV